MDSLSELLTKYFSEEKNLDQKSIYLSKIRFLPKLMGIPSGFLLWFGFKIPTELIETDKAFYFDTRQRILYDTIFGMVAFPFLSISIFYVVPTLFFHQIISTFVPIFIVGLSAVWALLTLLTKNWIQHILVIKKDWVSTNSIERGKHILKGNMPQVDPYLSNFLSKEEMKERWLIYKIPGLASLTKYSIDQGMKATLLRLDFTIEYEEI